MHGHMWCCMWLEFLINIIKKVKKKHNSELIWCPILSDVITVVLMQQLHQWCVVDLMDQEHYAMPAVSCGQIRYLRLLSSTITILDFSEHWNFKLIYLYSLDYVMDKRRVWIRNPHTRNIIQAIGPHLACPNVLGKAVTVFINYKMDPT